VGATLIPVTSTPLEAAARPRLCLPRELIASPLFLLGRLGFGVKTQTMEAFEAAGFSAYHYGVLALLDEGSCETQGTIADALRVDRSQLVGLLDSLEERSLIERRRDPKDRRRHLVSLTTDGKRQLAKFRSMVKHMEEEFLAPLDDESRATLHDLLLRLARHWDARFVTDNGA
jgi:DNA-binding MarR family transcriptional regulator